MTNPPFMTWQLTSALSPSAELTQLLDTAWEPFAVTTQGNNVTVWFRRWKQAFVP
jgi:hypothetical protein